MLRSALVVIGSPRPRTRDSSHPERGALEDEMGHDLWIRPTAKNKPIDPLCGHASVVMRTSETILLNTNMSTTRKWSGASDILLIIEHNASIRNESSNSQRGGGGAPAGRVLQRMGPPCWVGGPPLLQPHSSRRSNAAEPEESIAAVRVLLAGLPLLYSGFGTARREAGPRGSSHGRVKMGDWNFLGGILEEVHIHSTTVGKIWLTILFIFRMLVLGVAAEDVWNDEQSGFVCNTEQPGCQSVCYDRAFPISLIRYWVLQVIFVSAPSLVYMGHALYRLRALEKLRQRRKALLRRELELLDAAAEEAGAEAGAESAAAAAAARRRAERQVKQAEQGRLSKAPLRGALLRTYVAHVVTRSAVEVGFMAGQYLLYGARLRPLYRCERAPCPNAVDCYVSRPTEKSVFMVFMQAIAGVSLLLNLLEILHLGYKKLRQVFSYDARPRPRPGPRPCGWSEALVDQPLPEDQHHPDAAADGRYRGSSLGWAGARSVRKTGVAPAPGDHNLLLERLQCCSARPALLHPALSLPLRGGEPDDPGCPGCSAPEEEEEDLPLARGDSLSPQEGGGGRGGGGGEEEEEEDRDTSDADLPPGCSTPRRPREARQAPSCPALPVMVSRRQWNRCSTVMESRSSDTDSYGDAMAPTGGGGGGGPPAAWTRAKSDAKRPSPRSSSPESQKDFSEGSQHSPRPPSSNCKTSTGSCSSSRRPDLQI